MPNPHALDDDTAEALLRGDSVPPEWEPLADAVEAIRQAAAEPVAPSGELAENMSTGDFSNVRVPELQPAARRLIRPRLTVMSLRTRIAAGLAALLSGFTGVAAAGGLPDVVQDRVRGVIESVPPAMVANYTSPAGAEDDEQVSPADRDVGRQQTDSDGVLPEKAGENPGKGPDESGEKPGKGPDESGENPGKGPDESGEKPGKGPDESGENPGKGPDESGENPGKGPDESGENPGKGPDESGENPGKGPDESGENPGKGPDERGGNPGKGSSGLDTSPSTEDTSPSKGHGPPANRPARPGER